MTSLTALLIGMPDCLPKAYPEALRTEIGKKVRLLSEAVSGSEWKNHTAALAEADVLFATWGMPKLDADVDIVFRQMSCDKAAYGAQRNKTDIRMKCSCHR